MDVTYYHLIAYAEQLEQLLIYKEREVAALYEKVRELTGLKTI